MFGVSALSTVLVVWGVVTNLEKEQQEVRSRLERLRPYTAILGVTSGLLLVATAGFWVYQQFVNPSY
jgi:hypothetical protein